ncbi:MAG: hypothetical protein MUE59_15585 [Thiobacillaceae bacterium]|nr:hypothetical protein [Thiobacillaceae bacterium]
MRVFDAMERQFDSRHGESGLEDKGAEAVSVNPARKVRTVFEQYFVVHDVRRSIENCVYFSSI